MASHLHIEMEEERQEFLKIKTIIFEFWIFSRPHTATWGHSGPYHFTCSKWKSENILPYRQFVQSVTLLEAGSNWCSSFSERVHLLELYFERTFVRQPPWIIVSNFEEGSHWQVCPFFRRSYTSSVVSILSKLFLDCGSTKKKGQF